MRVGVLGGTFDPVHNGHLALGAAAREALALDEVLFIPAGDPWRKGARAITGAEHRLAMLRLAVEDIDAFAVSDIELRREGPTYTADTLEALAAERLDDAFWFIVGADALADVPNWHAPERLARHALLAVAPRGDSDVRSLVAALPALAGRIETFTMPPVQISSTEVRARVRAGEDISGCVPGAVARYIAAHRLYRKPA
jgi:nicotinate-nucleotide adenylyltransferase